MIDAFFWWTGAMFWTCWFVFGTAKAVRIGWVALRKRKTARMLNSTAP